MTRVTCIMLSFLLKVLNSKLFEFHESEGSIDLVQKPVFTMLRVFYIKTLNKEFS